MLPRIIKADVETVSGDNLDCVVSGNLAVANPPLSSVSFQWAYSLRIDVDNVPGTGLPVHKILGCTAVYNENGFKTCAGSLDEVFEDPIACNESLDGTLAAILDPASSMYPPPNLPGTWETLWGHSGHNPF